MKLIIINYENYISGNKGIFNFIIIFVIIIKYGISMKMY